MLSAVESASVSRSVVSEPLWPPCTVQSARLLCPWGSPGKNTGVGSYSLLQEIFPTQVSNPVSRTVGEFFTSEPPGKQLPFILTFLENWLIILRDLRSRPGIEPQPLDRQGIPCIF